MLPVLRVSTTSSFRPKRSEVEKPAFQPLTAANILQKRPFIVSICQYGLVHPALVLRIAFLILRRDVASILIEVHHAVLLAHVHLKLACGPPALPPVVSI